jgi:hypothetical protein
MLVFPEVFQVLHFAATLEVQHSSNVFLDSVEIIIVISAVCMFW